MLVTLKSTSHDNGISTDESAANWTNYFREGIHFTPDSTVQVVSVSINKTDDFIIEQGINDAFIYAIGTTGPTHIPTEDLGASKDSPFCQHRITVPAGAYTGSKLAVELQRLLANSTTLGSMKESWTVLYNPAGPNAPASFMFEWAQTTLAIEYDPLNYVYGTTPGVGVGLAEQGGLPAEDFLYPGAPSREWVRESMDLGAGPLIYAKLEFNKPTFNDLGGDTHIGIGGLTHDGEYYSGSILSEATIHPVGGNINVTIPPTNIISEIQLIRPGGGGGAGSNEIVISNWNGPQTSATATVTAVTPGLYNGYEYSMSIPTGELGAINVLTPLPGGGGFKLASITNGGTNWVQGEIHPLASQGSGVNATFEVTTVDANNNDALLSVTVRNPGANYAVGDVLTFPNPLAQMGLGLDGDGIMTEVLVDFLGTNLNPNDVWNLSPAVLNAQVTPDPEAFIRIETVGNGGEYATSVFWDRAYNYSSNDIVYIENSNGENPYFTVTSIMDAYSVFFAHVTEDGAMGMSQWNYPHDELAPDYGPVATSNLSTEWLLGFKVGGDENFPNITVGANSYLYEINMTSNTGTIGELYGTSPNTPIPAGMIIGDDQNNQLPITFTPSYPTTILGYVRQQMVPHYNAQSMDLAVSVIASEDNTTAYINIDQLQTIGNSFPNGSMEVMFNSDIKAIPGMTGFALGDWINLTIEVEQYTTVIVNAYHDTQGNGVFISNTDPILESLVTEVANQLVPDRTLFESNLRECMFPLRPVLFTGLGTGFDEASLPNTGDIYNGMATPYLTGDVDDTIVYPYSQNRWVYDYSTLVTGTSMDDSLFYSLPTKDPAVLAELPYFYKFGVLRDLDISDAIERVDSQAERALWSALVEPNTANMARTLAMFDVYNFDNTPETTALIESNPEKFPQPDTRNPTIQVELPDFGVKSFSGASADTGRAICAIPREQFTTDERSGTLHYESNYPVVIDLNCKDNIVLNHISCRLRNLDGKLSDLLNPTSVTLLIKEKSEASQARAFEKAMERMEGRKADSQSNRISMMNASVISPI